MQIRKVGVIGAGQMGAGIAQVCATAGFQVILQDRNEELCQKGLTAIKQSLGKFLERGKLTQEALEKILFNITTTTKMEDFGEIDCVIEAATENLEIKLKIFKKLDEVTGKNTILGSNTSSLSITKIAGATKRPEKVIGIHFMNPPPLIKGVEVIRGEKTSSETEKTVAVLIEKLGKTMVRSNDVAGFIANRVLMPMINEAARAMEEGVASKEDIDNCMTSCCNFPMGPLALADLIGLDTVEAILNIMHQELKDPRFIPAAVIKKYVKEGRLGRKTKKGFYEY